MIDGTGSGFIVTVVNAEVFVHPLEFETETEKFPADEAVMLCVVAPVFHKYELAETEVSKTLPPWQNVVLLPGVIIGVAGNAFTFTVAGLEIFEHPLELVAVTE